MTISVPDEGFSRNVPDEGYSSNVPDDGYSSNVPDEGYSSNVPDDGYSSNVPDEGYSSNVPDQGYSSNVPDEGYSRNRPCALIKISTFLFMHILLFIKAEPIVEILINRYEYIQGEDVSLNCSFTSYPEVEDVYWKKDGVRLSFSGQLTYGNFSGSPVLQLNNMAPNDSGLYECCVVNTVATKCGENILLGGNGYHDFS